MKRKLAMWLALVLCVLPIPVLAQSNLKDTLARHGRTSGELTIAVANAMPVDSYDFRPNPVEMSFGELMAHIAAINENACAIASGLPKPELPPKIVEWSKAPTKAEVSKETAVPFLNLRSLTSPIADISGGGRRSVRRSLKRIQLLR